MRRQRDVHGPQRPDTIPDVNEFTAVVERDERWFVAYCLEIPGANGQGLTKAEAIQSLREAISLTLDDRREDARRGIPTDAEQETVIVE